MQIKLSEHFTLAKLLYFTAPSVLMMILASTYSVVDGLFVSNYVGATAFAAVNIVFPFLMILAAIGFMFGTGGSALIAKTLGEKKSFKANQIFSMLVYVCLILGLLISFTALLSIETVFKKFGIDGQLLKQSLLYAKILLPFVPLFMLQFMFQNILVTAERPQLGMAVIATAGIANILFDAIFIIVFGWGLAGAAWATVISQIVGGAIPLFYFMYPNGSPLHLGKTKLYMAALIKACTNGLSEFLGQISMSVVAILYNYQLLRIAGENGVVAFGIISYVTFIFLSAFIGFSIGSNPIVSYHYGAQAKEELKSLLKMNTTVVWGMALFMTVLAELSARILANIFVSYDETLLDMTTYGLRIYAISFLFAGFNIYASGFFTALNNGFVSAVISVVRTLICECGCVLILPIFFGLNGIWSSIIVAELVALIISTTFILRYRTKYGYL